MGLLIGTLNKAYTKKFETVNWLTVEKKEQEKKRKRERKRETKRDRNKGKHDLLRHFSFFLWEI